MNDFSAEFDTSWINEVEQLNNINEIKHKEKMENIKVNCIFINKENFINKFVSEFTTLVSIVKSNENIEIGRGLYHSDICDKIEYKGKYKLSEILLFNVSIEPRYIQDYSNGILTDINAEFFHKLSIFDEYVVIHDSISIFHNINSIYYIFKELDEKQPKSIIKRKTRKSSNKKNNFTKKVLFSV
jgi:hypothetical protein